MDLKYGKVAHKLLIKQGWKEGQGLGSKGQGIDKPIKAQLKFDTTGIGHDISKEFTNHWWDIAFNKTAMQINVDHNEEEVLIKKNDKKKSQIKKKKNKLYNQFVQSATLTNGTMVEKNENCSENDDGEDYKLAEARTLIRMTDEELFKACNGMTAHKGARHGHKMSAKQARVEAKDKSLLHIVSESKVKPKKKKKKSKKSTKL